MPYIYLLGAILSEVFGTTMMKMTATNDNKLYIVGIAGGYILAFFLLSLAVVTLPLSFAYAVWSRVGTAFTAMVGFLVFKEQITKNGLIGIILIIAGVVLMRV
jgi:multidrug transporter EmrE-like cation transporter